MTESELNILLSEFRAFPTETEWLEFKVNNGKNLGEYISALSNSACVHNKDFGYLIFGIDDKSHRIVGTKFDLNQKGKGNEDLIPWISRLLNPRINFDTFEFKAEGERVIIIQVQAATNTPVKFNGESYIRIGSYKKKLDEYPEKQRLIWTKKSSSVFEKGVALKNVSADKVLGLLDYPSYFELLNIPLPENRKAIFEKFTQEKIIIKRADKYDITNLGAILLAKKLDEFETLSRKAIRVIIYQGKNKLKTKKEQIGQKGYAVGFKGLINYINDQLPVNEEIGKVFRKEVKMFPELAIRELVANAVIHQDFSINGTGPMIEIFENRVEISNPGKPLISTMRFVDHNPQSRNELLASFMRRMNICEERGSGIDKVIFECEYYQLPAPKFIEGENYTRVILYAHKSLRQMDKDDKTRACYLHACLKYVSGEHMTNQTLRNRFGIAEKNYSIASRIISEEGVN
ncbi:transcriptional regulator [Muricauda sp. TY007]|uniref:ATP-binding protein n=1 Tax=Allomuricauda sp. TY007 TaxID=2683200 RepID=UPI0013C20404|nr:ATP-binding protein [Muricauda sp. TY007]NDV16155.1 transcriptional regulator [Muricauda sp. TY007]